MKRYPIAPLLRRLKIELRPGRPEDDELSGVDRFIAVLDDHDSPYWWTRQTWPPAPATIRDWSVDGISALQADWMACRLASVHATDIWPDWDSDGELEGFTH